MNSDFRLGSLSNIGSKYYFGRWMGKDKKSKKSKKGD